VVISLFCRVLLIKVYGVHTKKKHYIPVAGLYCQAAAFSPASPSGVAPAAAAAAALVGFASELIASTVPPVNDGARREYNYVYI
jgi:hypothetical protein